MALRYPDRLESNNPAAYGIVKAIEIAGHRTVRTLSDLYTIADAILSDSGNNANNDAIGQSWYVVEENKEYQLIDWNNRKQASGWQATTAQLQEDITEVQGQLTNHINNKENPHTVTKAQIGLGNVDNTSDLDKPISTATQGALDGKVDKEANKSLVSNDLITKLEGLDNQDVINAAIADKIPLSQKGTANGVATLDGSGKVPSAQLPGFVDDVLEYDNFEAFPETGESGKIYVTKDTNLEYRWSGTQYTQISKSIGLGETSSTAYAGDKGKQVTDRVAEVYGANSTINGVSDVTFDSDDTEAQTLSADNALKTWDRSGTSHDMKIPYATSSKAGVMSAADKTKLDNSAAQTDLTALETRVETNESKLTVVQGEETVDGSIKKALKDAKDYTDSKLTWTILD